MVVVVADEATVVVSEDVEASVVSEEEDAVVEVSEALVLSEELSVLVPVASQPCWANRRQPRRAKSRTNMNRILSSCIL